MARKLTTTALDNRILSFITLESTSINFFLFTVGTWKFFLKNRPGPGFTKIEDNCTKGWGQNLHRKWTEHQTSCQEFKRANQNVFFIV